jgi:hypothetical protein
MAMPTYMIEKHRNPELLLADVGFAEYDRTKYLLGIDQGNVVLILLVLPCLYAKIGSEINISYS